MSAVARGLPRGGMRPTVALSLLPCPGPVVACGSCRPLVMARIAAEPFWPTVLMLALPVVLLVLLALVLHRGGSQR
jgi:hypothetical protein